MAITTAFCTSAKVDLLAARHNFLLSGGNAFKLAMYDAVAAFDADTTAYTASDEVSVGGGGTGYTAGGGALTRIDPSNPSGAVAITDFADLVFTLSGASATLAAEGCMIYNDDLTTPVADASVSVHSFSGSPSASGDGATFTVQFPAADASNAILRLA